MRYRLLLFLHLLILIGTISACATPTPPPTPLPPTLTPTPTPLPKVLTICLGREPQSLYPYQADPSTARHVWQALYDGPIDHRIYEHQPVILERLPTLENGEAVIEQATVGAGARVMTPQGEVVNLTPGVTVENGSGGRVVFDGTPVMMPQMVVTFTLRPNLYWSDGQLLTAADSVYAYQIAADLATPGDKYVIERTAGYWTAGVRTVVWQSLPGFLDPAYQLNFWPPMPYHAWGELSASELLTSELSTRRPLGWGPFVLEEWAAGDHITLTRNPLYFRASSGLPAVDRLTFRFLPDPAAMAEELLAGRCDLVTHESADSVRPELPADAPVEVVKTQDARWELLAFGITPAADYDRPDLFEDVHVRQGIARCIDRQTALSETMGTSGSVLDTYLPPDHPLHADGVTEWGYDPTAGAKLLAEAGWYDEDGDGLREAHGLPDIPEGTSLRFDYLTTEEPQRVALARQIATDLRECGVEATPTFVAPQTLFAPGPEGPLFGRRFDLAQFSLRATSDPLCELFLSSRIPGAGQWDAPNVTGWLDDDYDAACREALAALPGLGEFRARHMAAQRIFAQRLPALPLFQRQKVTLARPEVIGLQPGPTVSSVLWNVEQMDVVGGE